MPLEKPIKMGPNSYYFHGDIWTAEEIAQRWGIALSEAKSENAPQESVSVVSV